VNFVFFDSPFPDLPSLWGRFDRHFPTGTAEEKERLIQTVYSPRFGPHIPLILKDIYPLSEQQAKFFQSLPQPVPHFNKLKRGKALVLVRGTTGKEESVVVIRHYFSQVLSMPENELRLEYISPDVFPKHEIPKSIMHEQARFDFKKYALCTFSCETEETIVELALSKDRTATHFVLYEVELGLFGCPNKKAQKQHQNRAKTKKRPVRQTTDTPGNPFPILPVETILHILSFLEPKDLISCALTCRDFYVAVENDAVWMNLCRECLVTTDRISLPKSELSWKTYYYNLSQKKYLRLIMELNVKKNQIKCLWVDVNMGSHREVESTPFPDWRESDEERHDFIRDHPGYVD